MLRFLSVTGRWINQIEFNKRRITSYGTITNKKPNSSIISNSTYIAWVWWSYWVHADFYHNGVPFPSRNWPREKSFVAGP